MSEDAKPIELPPAVAMLQIVQGFWKSRAVYAIAELGIPDLLKDGPKSIEELARATGMHAPSLYRVLRAMASCGVFAEDIQHRFALTPIGATLRTDVPGSLRYFAIEELGGNHYCAWEKVLHSIKTGEIAFDLVYGTSKWQYHAEHPEDAKIFDEAMTSFSSVVNAEVVASYDFSTSQIVVDVGGGNGSLLATILKAHPSLRGVLADLPHVVEGAKFWCTKEGLDERCEVVATDFFTSAPKADTYVLKWIIHDWNDRQSVAILKNCRDAMTNGGRVLLVESLIQSGNASSFTKFMDLNMLVMTGGRERTETEYRSLLDSAGLKLTRIIPTQTEMSVIEGIRN